ncbi:hypothetical protein ACFQZ4_00400 [Catellatospora coxensis]
MILRIAHHPNRSSWTCRAGTPAARSAARAAAIQGGGPHRKTSRPASSGTRSASASWSV